MAIRPSKTDARGSGSGLRPVGPFSWVFRALDRLCAPLARRLDSLGGGSAGGSRLARVLSFAISQVHGLLAVVLPWCGRWSTRILRVVPWSSRLAVLLAVMAWLGMAFGLQARDWLLDYCAFSADALKVLRASEVFGSYAGWMKVSFLAGAASALCIPLVLVRRRFVLHAVAGACAAFLAVWAYHVHYLLGCPGVVFNASQKLLDKIGRNDLWLTGVLLWLPGMLAGLLLVYSLLLRSLRETYRAPTGGPPPLGDRIYVDVATGGRDPRFRSSLYWSVFFWLSLLIGPLLVRSCGMESAYGLVQGSGVQAVQVQVVKKKPKKKPKNRYVLATNSAFNFTRPDIDDSKVMEDVSQETEAEYQASTLAQGKLGKGGGTKGGWPSKYAGKIRFIRLVYGGGDWDQDMGKGADYNVLMELYKVTGYPVADKTEAIEINRLRRFPKDAAPPFVFITGAGGISVSVADVKTLRWYCLEENGMIFADNGGGHFNGSFRALMSRVFPDKHWIDIPNDDVIYRQPFHLPDGAPPLWHHSGYRALGLKHEGRWVVFYHQGDMNDAWKDDHSGAKPGVVAQSYHLAMNVMCYAFNQYLEVHGTMKKQ